MDILIITGMSGAGKTAALNIAQDNDYMSVDNIPPRLVYNYIEILRKERKNIDKVAFVIDIRVGEFLEELEALVEKLENNNHEVKIVYIDASDEELIKRYQEKRRPHPYKYLTLENAIKMERENLLNAMEISKYYIDTTGYNLNQLKSELLKILEITNEPKIKIVSFGFKYGILKAADFIFDTRFIDNPFYIKELKNKTGLDKAVYDYVFSFEESKIFVEKIYDIIKTVAPNFTKQGKNIILIGVGCTGGKHRSVAISKKLFGMFSTDDFDIELFHREKERWNK